MLKRLPIELKPDNRRVICFPYYHSIEREKSKTIKRIYNSIRSLDKVLIQETYDMVVDEFSTRHKTFFKILSSTFKYVKNYLPEKRASTR